MIILILQEILQNTKSERQLKLLWNKSKTFENILCLVVDIGSLLRIVLPLWPGT